MAVSHAHYKVADKPIHYCPECGYPMHCGCDACRPRLPKDMVPYRPTWDGEGYRCGNCGFVEGCDGWIEIEVAQYRAWCAVHGQIPNI